MPVLHLCQVCSVFGGHKILYVKVPTIWILSELEKAWVEVVVGSVVELVNKILILFYFLNLHQFSIYRFFGFFILLLLNSLLFFSLNNLHSNLMIRI